MILQGFFLLYKHSSFKTSEIKKKKQLQESKLEKRSKTVAVCRWHDTTYIYVCVCVCVYKSWRCYQKTTAAAAKSLQSCPTLCDPIDGSPPGCPVPGILQARTLEWVAISFSSAWKWKVKVKLFSRVWLLATPWTVAYQAPLSMGFSRQEHWSGVPLPSP